MVRRIVSFLLSFILAASCFGPVYADDVSWQQVDESENGRFEEDMARQGAEDPLDTELPYGAAKDMWLRIGLRYGSSAAASSTLGCADGFVLARVTRYECEIIEDYSEYESLYISCEDGRAVVWDEKDGEELFTLEDDMAVLSAAEDPEERIVTIDGGRYRDGASFKPYGSSMTVINRVTLEHYVRGVIANEMGYQYPAEALKAQAVTARSYAACSLGKHGSYGFDLCTGQNCQVYRGVSSERESTDAACRQTEDIVITYKGKPVSGYYYAYSSGYTLDSEDVWTSQPGYLLGVKDEYATEYLWKASVSFEKLRERLVSLGYDCGEIESVSVEKKLENGAMNVLLISSDSGDVRLSKSNITGALSAFGVKSIFFYIGGEDYPGAGGRPAGTIFALPDLKIEAEDEVWVIGAGGEPVSRPASELFVLKGRKVMEAFSGGEGSYRDETADAGMLYMTGFGYGHSVGMPQVSAKNMAEAGKSYAEILDYFYTGIDIRPLHGGE